MAAQDNKQKNKIKNTRKIIIYSFIVFLIFFLFLYLNNCINKKENKTALSYNNSCITESVNLLVRGNSMLPVLVPDDKIVLLQDYYDCNRVKRGDIIAYDYRGSDVPIVKRILVLGGDEVYFDQDELIVNGEKLVNHFGDAYIFDERQKKMIGLYIKTGKLTKKGYLIFGENVNDGTDSRSFGAVGVGDVLGKFEIE